MSVAPTFFCHPALSSFRYWLLLFFFCFSSLSAFPQEFPLPFTSVFLAYPSFCFIGLCVVICGSPFSLPLSARSLLLWSFAASLTVHLLRSSIFLLGFLLLSQLSSSVPFLTCLDNLPCWCVCIVFCCSPSLAVMLFSFFSFLFVFIGLAYGVLSCFLHSGSLCSLVICFTFLFVFSASLCAVLSRSSCFFGVVFFFLQYFSCSVFLTLLAILFSCACSWS